MLSPWMLLGLGALLGRCVTQQPPASCSVQSGSKDLGSVQYLPEPSRDSSSTFMSGFVHQFLITVQSNPFPTDLIVSLVKDPNGFANNRGMVLQYETGFLVCVAIGVLYIVLMPLVGLFLACCRCCGNCGGRLYQEQSEDLRCRRRTLYWVTMVTTIVIFAGNVCMFCSNKAFSDSMDRSPGIVNNTLDNVDTYIQSIPQQLNTVVNESFLTLDHVEQNLKDIGLLLGEEIQSGISSPLAAALASAHNMFIVVNKVNLTLAHLNATFMQLNPKLETLQQNLQSLIVNISNTLKSSSCSNCTSMQSEMNALSLDTNFTNLDLSKLQTALDIKGNLDALVTTAETFNQTIPQQVVNKTRDTIQSATNELQNIKGMLSNMGQSFNLQFLANVSSFIKNGKMTFQKYFPQVQKADNYRRSVTVALCCLVLLVVICNALGLFLGPLGLCPKVDPTERSLAANCGGHFLLAGVGFSFLFCWFLMLVVTLLCVLGGNAFMLFCKPFSDKQLFQLIDTPGLFPNMNLSNMLHMNAHISVGQLYSDCQIDSPLWTTLHLSQQYNIDDLLNISKYTGDMKQKFDSVNISLNAIDLLNGDLRSRLLNVSSGALGVDFSNVTMQMINFSKTNLNTTANLLQNFSNTQSNSEIKKQLQAEAAGLRGIQSEIELLIMPDVRDVNNTLQSLSGSILQLNGSVTNLLGTVDAAQLFLSNNVAQMVKAKADAFLNCQIYYFTSYSDWAKRMITQEFGRCKPLAGAVDSVETLACAYLVESLNAFWFSLGWCLMFFIPSIIFSVKLSKFYRRMKYSDVFENTIEMNPFPTTLSKEMLMHYQ